MSKQMHRSFSQIEFYTRKEYPIRMEKNRLSKILARAGIASRRACEQFIFEGKVTVNGQIVLAPQLLVNLQEDDVWFDGQKISSEQEKIYYILNKPFGFICSNKPMERKKIVIDLFPKDKRLFTIGRLDRDTTGLLLVTNDGYFSQSVIHPKANIEKEYLVKTLQEITHENLKKISLGAFVDGAFVRPISVKKVRRGTLKIVVKEGRKREVRVFVQKAGLTIRQLTRIRLGGLTLGNILPGTYQMMSRKEKEAIFKK